MMLQNIILFGIINEVICASVNTTDVKSSSIETTTVNMLEKTATEDHASINITESHKHRKCNMSGHHSNTEDSLQLNEANDTSSKKGVSQEPIFNVYFDPDQPFGSEIETENSTATVLATATVTASPTVTATATPATSSTTANSTITSENFSAESNETTKMYTQATTTTKPTTGKTTTQTVVVITPKPILKNASRPSHHPENLTINSDMLGKCPKYKNGAHMDINQMIGEWETIYHIMPEPVSCFKINITRVKSDERAGYKEKYGDDGQQINWDLCEIDIQSSTADPKIKKHCLISEIGGVRNFGIFDNIVVSDKEATTNDSVVVMRGEPDQWRTIHDLLLLRDCSSGGIVVFGKPTRRPSMDEIRHTLKVYGEFSSDGTLLCDDNDLFVVSEEDELEIQ